MTRFVVALAACCLLVGCEEKVTLDNYDMIEVGMAQHQVESILGAGVNQDSSGRGIDSSGLMTGSGDKGTRSTYLWEENGRQIIITFEDQKVKTKQKNGF